MFLLNTTTYKLKEFFGNVIPPYAILSHRWETEEVLFKDLIVFGKNGGRKKKGWAKIQGCCKQGLEDGLEWVWVDSCCIDKTSSAELSEAINSMFNWYQNAEKCYAYLSDVGEPKLKQESKTHDFRMVDFPRSKWFTRGWTLQELLAPKKLIFFNQFWEALGDKVELMRLVEDVTGISDLGNFEEASIAQKFSWAAKRECTRVEDRAYSLMGLFGVNLSPIYGEGEKAFLRLQMEIIKISNDETIFAWRDSGFTASGLLAQSPDAFKLSGNVRPFDYDYDRPAFAMTNKGLRIESHLINEPVRGVECDYETEFFALQCAEVGKNGEAARLAICLRYIQGDMYARLDPSELVVLDQTQEDYLQNMSNDQGGGRDVFHVKQFSGPCLDFQGPYTFIIKTCPEVKQQFQFVRPVDWHVSKPARGRWSISASSEAILQTCELPVAGMNAAIMFQEIDSNCNKKPSKKRDKFVLVIDICKHKVQYAVLSLPPDDQGKNVETVMETWKQDRGRWGDTWSAVAKLNSGTFLDVKMRCIDGDSVIYEMSIDVDSKGEAAQIENPGDGLITTKRVGVEHLTPQKIFESKIAGKEMASLSRSFNELVELGQD